MTGYFPANFRDFWCLAGHAEIAPNQPIKHAQQGPSLARWALSIQVSSNHVRQANRGLCGRLRQLFHSDRTAYHRFDKLSISYQKPSNFLFLAGTYIARLKIWSFAPGHRPKSLQGNGRFRQNLFAHPQKDAVYVAIQATQYKVRNQRYRTDGT